MAAATGRPAGATIAAIVAILGSALFILLAFVMVLTGFVPHLPLRRSIPAS